MPFTIGYSFRHTGHPTIPDRTILPSISPVESTSTSSSWGSGQRSISVSSMCIGAEYHPGQLVLPHADPARKAPSVHIDGQCVVTERHVTHGEMLLIDRVRMIVLPVGL